MNKKKFIKKFLILAIPIMIQYLITTSVNLMDNFMIGQLGEKSVAALGIANQYYFIFNLLILGINSGGSVLISQFWGAYKYKKIKKILNACIKLSLATSLLFTTFGLLYSDFIIKIFTKDTSVIILGSQYLKIVCFSYLFISISLAYGSASRSIEKAILPMTTSFIALVFNIILNYTLIFGHFGFNAYGVKGAAIATLISRIIEMLCLTIYIYNQKNSILKINYKNLFILNKNLFKKTLKVSTPVIINEFCWGSGMIIYSIIYGHLGTKSIASVQICMAVQNLFLTFLFGVANAASVMIGNVIGNSNYKLSHKYASYFVKISLFSSFFISGLLIIFIPQIISIYNLMPETILLTKKLLFITAISLPIKFINILFIVGIFRGSGDAKNALIIESSTMWFIGVPICIISAFVLNLNTATVFSFVLLEEIVRFFACIKRYKSKKWINNIVSPKQKIA